jgi:SNF2 family DNA or RNA helicase
MIGILNNLLGSGGNDGDPLEVVSRIRLDEHNTGLEFRIRRENGEEHVSLSELHGDTSKYDLEPGSLAQISMLVRLYADELVRETRSGGYRLPFHDVYQLDPVERRSIEVEIQRDWDVYVDVEEVIGQGTNPLRIDFDPPWGLGGPELDEMQDVECGFVDSKSSNLHVLPEEIVQIRELTNRTIEGQSDSRAAEYRLLGKLSEQLKSASAAARDMITLDKQLEDENYVAPDEVRVDFRQRDDGSLELRPLVDGFDDFQSAETILEAESEERLFKRELENEEVESEKMRVALDDSTLREVNRVRERSEVPADEVDDFVEEPREYLQPAEEFHEECAREAERTGASVDEVVEERVETEKLNLEPVKERIGRLKVEDYGDRVQGFREVSDSEEQDEREAGVELDGQWFETSEEEAESSTSTENSESSDEEQSPESKRDQNESNDSSTGDVEVDSSEEPAADEGEIELITADNDAELAYEAVVEGRAPSDSGQLEEPTPFDGKLYPYQRQGFSWLTALSQSDEEVGEGGGLLADDTGLGKTIQVIALLARRFDNDMLTPSLLVVPKTLMPNWESELKDFCPDIGPIYRHHGSNRLEHPERIAEKQVVVTTYGTLCADQLVLGKIKFEVMVCDEAQKIKNYTTKRSAACRAMDAKMKLPLTATPVENTLEDLWSIMDFCQPGILETLPEFQEQFVNPIEKPNNETQRQRAANELLARIRGHYVRRRKSNVLADKLPPKEVHIRKVDLTEYQKASYEKIRKAYEQSDGLGEIFQVINNLLRVCTHPAIVPDREEGIASVVEPRDLEYLCGREQEIVSESGKLQYVFEEVLPEIYDREEKVLIFTQFRRSQILTQKLVQGYFDFLPSVINGEASGSQRQTAVEEFGDREGFGVIVLSPRAAGVGLNMQEANHVIHLTREWNPAKEKQAADRVYRIGQEREVHEYKPISVSDEHDETADERLAELLRKKREMAETVMYPDGSSQVPANNFEDLV